MMEDDNTNQAKKIDENLNKVDLTQKDHARRWRSIRMLYLIMFFDSFC